MPRITISYRRNDSDVITGRIFDRLVGRYGRNSVFRDIDNIPLGVDFRQHIDRALGASDVVLAIVGPQWLGARETGNRLDDVADPVRLEIETTLRKGVPLIPVLVLDAAMPLTAELPDNVKDFAFRNAIRIDAGQDFDIHIARLIRAMDRMLGTPARGAATEGEPRPARKKAPWVYTAIAAVLVAVAGVAVVGRYFSAPLSGGARSTSATATTSLPPAATVKLEATPPPAPAIPPPPPAPIVDTETVFWQSIASSGNAAEFSEYLRRYPDGRYARLAHNRLAELRPPPPPAPQRSASGRYLVNSCGSIVDGRTQFEWYVAPDDQLSWSEAVDWTKNLSACGKRWRMPTLDELKTLFDPAVAAGTGFYTAGKYWPAHIDPIFAKIGNDSWVWTVGAIESLGAPTINFYLGTGARIKLGSNATVRAFAIADR